MNYSVVIDIHKPIELVAYRYLSTTDLQKWQTNLVTIESIKGELFEKGSCGYLIYTADSSKMKLKTTVIEVDLPHKLKVQYEMPGVINICDIRFSSVDTYTRLTVDVLFTFDDDKLRDPEVFKHQTLSGLNLYKYYVEAI